MTRNFNCRSLVCKLVVLLYLLLLVNMPTTAGTQTNHQQKMRTNGGKPVTEDILDALNAYVAFLNAEIEQSLEFPIYLSRYHSEVERFIKATDKNWPGPYYFSDHKSYILPSPAFEKALSESKKLQKKYRRQINDEIQVLYNLLVEKEHLIVELHQYASQKNYWEDDFERYYEIYSRLTFILRQIEILQTAIYKTVVYVYQNYSTVGMDDAVLELSEYFSTTINRNTLFISKISNNIDKKDSIGQIVNDFELRRTKKIQICEQSENVATMRQISSFITDSENRIHNLMKKALAYDIYPHNESDIMLLITNAQNSAIGKYNEWSDLIKDAHDCVPEKSKPVLLLKKKRQTLNYLLDIEVHTPEITVNKAPFRNAPTNHLILLLDVSGSMNSPERLPILKSALKSVLKLMRSTDHISIITFSGSAEVRLRKLSCINHDSIFTILNNLRSSGGTDINKGVRLAYMLAEKHYIENGNNKIILATDGDFNMSKRSRKLVKRSTEQKITLSVFNFNQYKSTAILLEGVAQLGRGKHYQITRDNIARALIDELTQNR